jgi:hypothetical protein
MHLCCGCALQGADVMRGVDEDAFYLAELDPNSNRLFITDGATVSSSAFSSVCLLN